MARITPACAGRTPLNISAARRPQDHPRVCGKNKTTHNVIRVSRGSPPRVREELYFFIYNIVYIGITPACAGRTSAPFRSPRGCRDHPRVCGKNSPDEGYTGERRDHPRVCGKNKMRAQLFDAAVGSPPRVREEREGYFDKTTHDGITPACAGRT